LIHTSEINKLLIFKTTIILLLVRLRICLSDKKICIIFQVKKIILLIAIPIILEIIYISENLEFIYLSFEKFQTLSLCYMQTGPGLSNLKPYLEIKKYSSWAYWFEPNSCLDLESNIIAQTPFLPTLLGF
jgi:hypothetical protein